MTGAALSVVALNHAALSLRGSGLKQMLTFHYFPLKQSGKMNTEYQFGYLFSLVEQGIDRKR